MQVILQTFLSKTQQIVSQKAVFSPFLLDQEILWAMGNRQPAQRQPNGRTDLWKFFWNLVWVDWAWPDLVDNYFFETGINEKLGIRASAQQDKIFIGMILILIFAEALGLYGFIVGIIIANS